MNLVAFIVAVIAAVMLLWDGAQHANAGPAHRCWYVFALGVFAVAFILTFVIQGHNVSLTWS